MGHSFAQKTVGELPPPQPGPQTAFLESEADIAIFGGAAGSGKTSALLLDMAAPNLLATPGYSAVIFRRTYPQIRNEGGIWDESAKLYSEIGGQPLDGRLEWRFPGKQTIRFSHLQHDKNVYDWQGAQLARIGYDELTHFSETQFFYLLGRARTDIGIRPRVRATCNPDADSWVAKIIDWWIGEDGLPIQARSGVLRWFVRINGDLIWGDTAEELQTLYPGQQPKSLTFIPAKLTDNPILLERDPGYLANLQAQHPVERARLLEGNWKARFGQGRVFSREWATVIDELPLINGRVVRFWDLAATAKDVATRSSFYTASVKAFAGDNALVILDVTWHQEAAGEVLPLIAAIASQDGPSVAVRWELEGGSAGKIVEQQLKSLVRGYDARAVKPLGDKLSRFLPVATLAQQGRFSLLRAPWNDVYLNSLQSFDGSSQPLVNDLTDATSGAYHELVRRQTIVQGSVAW